MDWRFPWLLACALAGPVVAAAPTHPPAAPGTGPLTPSRALALFDHEPGLKVELAAAEPFVVAPCAFAWDESGALYVAENRGYPTGDPNGKPTGRIARLTDTDGDGVYDRRTEFAEGLSFPNGVLPWRGGLLVTCAPDVLWLKDTDGDGKADVREVILTGFALNQSTQLRVNKPQLAPDGWVYLASGFSGGHITSPKRLGDPALDLHGDLRFNPDSGEFEAVDGRTQFGQDFDDFGRRFGCQDRVQVRHFVTASSWFARQPGLVPPELPHNCPELIPNPLLRTGGGAAPLHPISHNLTTADSHAGTFTAACGVTLWRGGTLPDRYQGGVFSCDPTANLVHFDRLEPAGATFSARPLPGTNEFLRSPDDWFRPVYLGVGPDGALYVADLYRKTIEHPDNLPEAIRKRTDLRAGEDLGRLWRVTSDRSPARRPKRNRLPGPAETIRNPAALLSDLSQTNSWRRDTALRLLRESPDAASLNGPLHAGFRASRSARSAALFLQLLARIDALDGPVIAAALNSPHPEVRELALRFAIPFLTGPSDLATLAVNRARDEQPRVRFQAALSLGELRESAPQLALPALSQIAIRDGHDPWFRAAILSSIHGQERGFLGRLMAQPPQPNDPVLPLLADLGELLGRTVPTDAFVEVFADTLGGPGTDLARALALLGPFTEAAGARTNVLFDPLAAAAGTVAAAKWQVLKEAALGSLDPPGPDPFQRLVALRLVSQMDPESAQKVRLKLLRQETDPLLLAAVLRQLADPDHPELARPLVDPTHWPPLPPATRLLVLNALADHIELHPLLAQALEQHLAPTGFLTPSQRDSLRRTRDPELRVRFGAILSGAVAPERRQAFGAARAALQLTPVPAQGREVFRRNCTDCHRLDQEGFAVGPDLLDVRNQSKDTLLQHLVIPEQEITPGFANQVCKTRDGRTLTGLLVANGAAGTVLRQAKGVTRTVARAEVRSLELSPLPMMPQGLEKAMSLQELADLLAYLQGER